MNSSRNAMRLLALGVALGSTWLAISETREDKPSASRLDLSAPAEARDARGIPPARRVTLPDGRRLNLRCTGSGTPTVVLEAGFGASSLAWTKVQSQIARKNRVCSYDRAGYGLSDPGTLPRDGAAIARDLDAALDAAHLRGPFIMVGHSSGGLYVRLFANRHPRNIAGMVLVDPSVEHQERRFVQAFGPGAGSIAGHRRREIQCIQSLAQASRQDNSSRDTSGCRTRLSELDNLWSATSRKLDSGPRSYGALPLVVLTADGTYSGRAAAFWFALHDEIAARSIRGKHYLVSNSSHMMIRDRPDAIVSAIQEVSAASRRRPHE